jgi:hypothetical protein
LEKQTPMPLRRDRIPGGHKLVPLYLQIQRRTDGIRTVTLNSKEEWRYQDAVTASLEGTSWSHSTCMVTRTNRMSELGNIPHSWPIGRPHTTRYDEPQTGTLVRGVDSGSEGWIRAHMGWIQAQRGWIQAQRCKTRSVWRASNRRIGQRGGFRLTEYKEQSKLRIHFHWMFTECSLNVQWMFIEYKEQSKLIIHDSSIAVIVTYPKYMHKSPQFRVIWYLTCHAKLTQLIAFGCDSSIFQSYFTQGFVAGVVLNCVKMLEMVWNCL